MYDTVWIKDKIGDDIGIQFKNGHCVGESYNIGEKVPLSDGIYFGNEGSFVVFNEIIVAAFDKSEPFIFDKWGGQVPYPKLIIKTT